MKTPKKGKAAKTIKFSELKRLSFCNSKKLPPRVWIGDQLKWWVGFGWVDLDPDEAVGDEPTVVDD